MHSMFKFGPLIMEYREREKLSLEDFAKLMKVSRGKVVAWENDKETPPNEVLQSIEFGLGLHYHTLVAHKFWNFIEEKKISMDVMLDPEILKHHLRPKPANHIG